MARPRSPRRPHAGRARGAPPLRDAGRGGVWVTSSPAMLMRLLALGCLKRPGEGPGWAEVGVAEQLVPPADVVGREQVGNRCLAQLCAAVARLGRVDDAEVSD